MANEKMAKKEERREEKKESSMLYIKGYNLRVLNKLIRRLV